MNLKSHAGPSLPDSSFFQLKAVYDEFLCPICFSPIQNCYMTPCGVRPPPFATIFYYKIK
jgi:hypothetical protein